MTEGRYLVWESGSHALTYSSTYSRNKKLSYSGTAEKLSARHDNPSVLPTPAVQQRSDLRLRQQKAAHSSGGVRPFHSYRQHIQDPLLIGRWK